MRLILSKRNGDVFPARQIRKGRPVDSGRPFRISSKSGHGTAHGYWFIVTSSSSFERVDSMCFLMTSMASTEFMSER